MHAFGEDAYSESLTNFTAALPKPKGIVFLSSHTVSSDKIHVLSTDKNNIQYDFSGYPEELYKINYECPGDPALAKQVSDLLHHAKFETSIDTAAPLDHGMWIPLMHLYPKGDVPVVRVSLPLHFTPAQVLKMGHSLAALREQGVLIVASGGAVHNLDKMKWTEKRGSGQKWALEFEAWIIEVLKHKDIEALLASEENPHFKKAHPTLEHFLPLFFTVGAALTGDEITVIFKGIEYDSLSMLCFSLNHVQNQSLH